MEAICTTLSMRDRPAVPANEVCQVDVLVLTARLGLSVNLRNDSSTLFVLVIAEGMIMAKYYGV